MERKDLEKLVERKLSQYQIAKVYNIGQTTVRYWLAKYGLRTKWSGKLPIYECIWCGNKFHSRRRDMLICSKECGRNIRLQSYIKKIEKKITDGLPFSARTAKRYLLATAGNKCSICEIRKWLGKSVGLIIDHINGDSNDNTIKNLRLVCGNCDMQLPTYKGRNAGNGRFSRRKRYAEGKSY